MTAVRHAAWAIHPARHLVMTAARHAALAIHPARLQVLIVARKANPARKSVGVRLHRLANPALVTVLHAPADGALTATPNGR
jgi:hypothetical protein